MKVIKGDTELTFYDKIIEAENKLRNFKILVLESHDYLDHIASFIAWRNIGGNILIKSPILPQEQKESLDKQIQDKVFENSIIFHTSGTTGQPKIVVHKEKQMLQAVKMASETIKWDQNSNFLNFIPPFTSGFWHIVLSPLVYYDASVTIGTRETIANDFKQDSNTILIVPALIDQLKFRKIPVDFSKYRSVGIGGSQVLRRHAEYCFKNNARYFNHLYGQTETCSPILGRETDHLDDFVEYMEVAARADNISKIVNKELWIKGQSICENIDDFDNEDGWIKTGDLWEQNGNLIKFIGRKNDIVKINGYFCSLLLIENIAEDETDLGDTIAVPRNSLGSDWIELFYTNKDAVIDKDKLSNIFEPKVPKCNIPLKYTYIESISRNSLGKKLRHVF